MTLEEARARIDSINEDLVKLLSERFDVVKEIGEYKKQNNLPVYDEARENAVIEKVTSLVSEEYKAPISWVFKIIMSESRALETENTLFGVVGKSVSSSFSPFIHHLLGNTSYKTISVPETEIEDFIKSRKFNGINITMPYKKLVFSLCDVVSDTAKALKNVNVVVNKNGVLYGDNTDFYGMRFALETAGIEIKNKKVLILGSGGASATAQYLCKTLCAASVSVVSRKGALNYENVYADREDTEVIINCTPVGMGGDFRSCPIDLEKFGHLESVFDCVYLPVRTSLILKAEDLGLKACGGLPMLVAQAVKASELFGFKAPDALEILKEVRKKTEIISMIGMSGSGKSTVAAAINEDAPDSDKIIEKMLKKSIPEIFNERGEPYFRAVETAAINIALDEAFTLDGYKILSVGGGAVLDEENMLSLRHKGPVVFLDRDVSALDRSDRPLAKDDAAVKKLYEARLPLYKKYSDFTVKNDSSVASAAKKIKEAFDEITCY